MKRISRAVGEREREKKQREKERVREKSVQLAARDGRGGVGNESYAKKDDHSLHMFVKYSGTNKMGSVSEQ